MRKEQDPQQRDFRVLASVEIFRDLDEKGVAAIARRCVWRTYTAGQTILSHLDNSNDVYFILVGRVRVNVYSPDGRDVTFGDIERGEMFGELAALDEAPRSANVIALVDTTIASMPAKDFWELLRDHPEVAAATLRRLVRLVRSLSERVYEFSTLGVRNRIHAELLRLCRHHMVAANQAKLEPAPTHAEIASRISTHREAVTREIGDLARAGVIVRQGHALLVQDVARLARLVERAGGT